jgi:3,4-dihydroxy 2-butanone 4-phosphate synthase/GTP cyclohydrolase II
MIDIKTAIQKLKSGKILIVVDDENRENEGDMVIPAETITPDIINFMTKEARGLLCISLPEKRLVKLNISPMTDNNTNHHGTAFYISCEARTGVTTGISAYDRFQTIKKLIDINSKNEDFVFPGHTFPLKAEDGGVLVRRGHTEASADLASLSGFLPSGIIIEIMDDDGKMAHMPKLEKISKKFNIDIVTIDSLVKYREENNLLDSLYKDW